MAQNKTPKIVGINTETNVHFKLLVSRLIVRQVVEQGKCSTVIIIMQIAVVKVHPIAVGNCNNSSYPAYSTSVPLAI